MEKLERGQQGFKFSKPELEAQSGSEGRSHVDEVDSLGAGRSGEIIAEFGPSPGTSHGWIVAQDTCYTQTAVL
jgi:hypothetical protein